MRLADHNHFPELSKAVADRYIQYQNALKEKRADVLRQTTRLAVIHITAAGLYVSAGRVKGYVKLHLSGVGREYLFQQAFSEVKAEMGIAK